MEHGFDSEQSLSTSTVQMWISLACLAPLPAPDLGLIRFEERIGMSATFAEALLHTTLLRDDNLEQARPRHDTPS